MNVYLPRIHNLGDFIHCLPVLSGIYKKTGLISFGICDRLNRFNGIKDLLMSQQIFSNVHFMSEQLIAANYIIIDDSQSDLGVEYEPLVVRRYYNFVRNNYPEFYFDLDVDFELIVPFHSDSLIHENKILVGDRWSSNDATDVDERRFSNNIQRYDKFNTDRFLYLDFTKELLYNLSLIKYNKNPFISTFTGIGILSDMMSKETHILWDDDLYNWDNNPISYAFELHYYKNRSSYLHYIKDFLI